MELKEDYFVKLQTKKYVANRNANYLKLIADDEEYNFLKDKMIRRSDRIKECLNYWEWAKYDKNKLLDLIKVSRCKDKYCPNCRSFDLAKLIYRLDNQIGKLISIEKYYPYLMTLTIPNVYGMDLKSTLKRLNKSYKILWNWLFCNEKKKSFEKRIFDAEASIRVLEITYNKKTNMFHPHIHALLFLKNVSEMDFIKQYDGGYQFKTDSYINYSEADYFIQRLWTLAFNDMGLEGMKLLEEDMMLIADIREVILPGGLYEVFKYCFKDNDINSKSNFKFIFEALQGIRIRQSYGDLFNVDDKEEEDIINEEEDLKNWLKIEEEFNIYRSNDILEAVNRFKEYTKISRFNKDKYYLNIKD